MAERDETHGYTRIDSLAIRAIGVEADADVRSIRKELRAPGSVRGRAGERIRAVLARRGMSSADTHTARVRYGKWLQSVAAPTLPDSESPWETTELRVRPLRVGGRGALTVDLASDSEAAPFVVHATIEQARVLGSILQGEIDVVLSVCRDVDGHIERGRLLDVLRLDDGEPLAAWRTWAAEHAGEWDDIEDVVGELARCN